MIPGGLLHFGSEFGDEMGAPPWHKDALTRGIGRDGQVGAGPGSLDTVDRLLNLECRQPPISGQPVVPSDQSDVLAPPPSLCRLASNALDASGGRIPGCIVNVDEDAAGDHLDLRPGRRRELAAIVEGGQQGRQGAIQPARSGQPAHFR